MYEEIDPQIRYRFNNVFSSSIIHAFPLPGFLVGCGLFAYAFLFNFTVPTRVMYFATPILADYFWTRRSTVSEISPSNFLDWVFEYRKARVFNERYKK
jgi:hypothetical protein